MGPGKPGLDTERVSSRTDRISLEYLPWDKECCVKSTYRPPSPRGGSQVCEQGAGTLAEHAGLS